MVVRIFAIFCVVFCFSFSVFANVNQSAQGAYYDAQTYINPVKAKMEQQHEMVFGAYVTIPCVQVIENLAYPHKLDFVWIDAEHAAFGPEAVQRLVIAAENQHIVPIVRVPMNGIENIKKYIGTGVMGIVVPNIKTAHDAQIAVDAVKYRPEGKRHVGPERATGYLAHLKQYMANANKQTLVIVMIETKQAVKNINAILKVKGIDVVHIGPYDLSQSMGVDRDSPQLKAAIAKVEKAAVRAHVALGSYAPNLKTAQQLYKRGYRFFTIPGDMQILQAGVNDFFNNN